MKQEIPELKEFNIPKISGYEIVGYIGKGTWTPVFKAIRKTDGSEWALKFYRPDELGRQYVEEGKWTEEEFWKKECQGGKTPVHQNIAYNFLDTADNGENFLAEVYVGERFLDQYLDQVKAPSLDEIVNISRGMAAALEVQHTHAGGKGRAHGDFAPKNMAYGLDEIIKLSDFGTSTIGERDIGKRGYPEVRALEQFSSTESPSKQGDVFSFGSVLYKLFTGKYAFEDELSRLGEEHMSYLAENPAIWNKTIDEKVNDIKIPKQFRKFLKRCLYAPEEVTKEGLLSKLLPSSKGRIKDGVELQKELEKTVKKYEAGKTRWKRYSIAAAAVLALGVGIGFGVNKLSNEFKQREKELMYEKKVRVAKMHKDNASSLYNDSEESMEFGKLRGLYFALKKDGIEDPMIQYAAYLNPELTYEAIMEVGKEYNHDFSKYIRDRDIELGSALWRIEGGGTDHLTRFISASRADKVKERWAQIKLDYQERKREEARNKRWSDGGFGPRGPN